MNPTAPLLVVTGLSGAGKTLAMKALEDLHYFCIDNLPPSFLPELVRLPSIVADERRLAVAMDVRGGDLFAELFATLDTLRRDGTPHQILFLDCADDVLVRRFSETRRRHPVREGHSLFEQIAAERRLLAGIRDRADIVLDTTRTSGHALKERLSELVAGRPLAEGMTVDVVSFGFKHGVPLDADLVFDVRFLPNPYYELPLRKQTGLDAPVRDYVFERPEAQGIVDDVVGFVERWRAAYAATGRPRLTVAIGCTGGQHRSVALTEAIAERLRGEHPNVSALHRDMPRAVTAGSEATSDTPRG